MRGRSARGRSSAATEFIQELSPHWNHNSGYAELGKLGFEANLFAIARQFIEKLRESYQHHYRSETMGHLARIYAIDGRSEDGRALLRECIARIEADESCSPREVARFCAPLIEALRELDS